MIDATNRFLAKRLFVNDGWSVEQIAEKCRVAKNTIIRWRDMEQWQEQRKQFLESAESFSEECFLFATKVMRDIRKKYDDDANVSNSQINLLNLLLSRIETIIEIDLKRKSIKEQSEGGQEIPVEVAADPEVAEYLEKISEKIEAYKLTAGAGLSRNSQQKEK